MTKDGEQRREDAVDAFLGGRLSVHQPLGGHRAGMDAVVLAAFVDAEAGARVADLGAGVGVAGLCVAARIRVDLTLVERAPDLAALAVKNAARNGVAATIITADVTAPAKTLAAAGLAPDSFEHVLFNPPFHDGARHRVSPDAARAAAHMGDEDVLAAWLKTAHRLLRPRGTVSLIHRADRLDMVLSLMRNSFGGLRVVPIASKMDAAALRVVVSGIKGSRARLSLLPPLLLAGADGRPSDEAERILRHGARLER